MLSTRAIPEVKRARSALHNSQAISLSHFLCHCHPLGSSRQKSLLTQSGWFQQHPHHLQQGTVPIPQHHRQHPRSSNIVRQQQKSNSPRPPAQSQHTGAFPSQHATSHGIPIQHQSPYPQQGPSGQPPPESTYYPQQASYGAPASGQYSSPGTPSFQFRLAGSFLARGWVCIVKNYADPE